MTELADTVGVARLTLYRWCGDRHQLLSDVIWSVTEPTIHASWAQASNRRGANRALQAIRTFLEVITASEPLNAYLRDETHAALRLLTTRGGFQDRLVGAISTLLAAEADAGRLELRGTPDDVAYAITRVAEGFVYNDAIAAIEPQIDRAMAIVELILR